MYGDSESLLGKWFALYPERRADIFLATKFALRFRKKLDGNFGLLVDSSPEYCRQQCEASLKRLGTEYIDLYYVHRVDGRTPVEKTMGELVKLKEYVEFKQWCGEFQVMFGADAETGRARSATLAYPLLRRTRSAVHTPSTPWPPTRSSTPHGHWRSRDPTGNTFCRRAVSWASPCLRTHHWAGES